MKFDLVRPCKDCPFRSDIPGYLTAARARDILHAITAEQRTFSCHKTNTPAPDGVEMIETRDSQHCAGALIFLERIGKPNQLMRIAERLGFYNHRRLDMSSPVHRSARAMIDAQRIKRKKAATAPARG